jgi:hypothetical protein
VVAAAILAARRLDAQGADRPESGALGQRTVHPDGPGAPVDQRALADDLQAVRRSGGDAAARLARDPAGKLALECGTLARREIRVARRAAGQDDRHKKGKEGPGHAPS